MAKKRVVVAMSGGVDSSVAAALLKKAGYEVSGIYMQLWPDSDPSAKSDLERTCRLLDIPFYQLDLEREFKRLVVDYFCGEYSLGRTPNPCVVCNQQLKFGLLLEKIREMGAEYLATGHYARAEPPPDGYRLLKAVDITKDQSYFLYTLGQEQLKHLLLPLGGMSKEEVRKTANELDLPMNSRRDSQDVCFIPDNDYRAFIAEHVSLKAGEIVDINEKVLGKHGGLARYTVGQRQGLGLDSAEPLYVLKLDAADNRLVVGSREQALHNALTASRISWVSGKTPEKRLKITARVRYKAPDLAAELRPINGGAEIRFLKPQWAIAPGQSVVFYQGDAVLGGGVIDAVLS
ncbi:MAG TPA: tRNA 2-thiouridine(34) synthase MnmA [Dehalococcoidia bacterium]|nr:tRNA 2-thiouridine(34) synthase MnmA [Dehalococcoidia bacterium]